MDDSSLTYVDSHAHLCADVFDQDLERLIKDFRNNQIEAVITVGDCIESSKKSLTLSEKHPDIFCAAGFHPHYANDFKEESLKQLSPLFANQKVVAFGEIGLDYHYEFAPKDIQKKVLETLLEFALIIKKPVIFHNRKSDDDLYHMVKDLSLSTFGCVLHCFDSSLKTAEKFLDLGFFLSFSGLITFRNVSEVLDVLKYVPLDRMMIETDCPYLSPHPMRGKRNEPSFIKHTAEKVAEIKNMPVDLTVNQLNQNTYQFYRISQKK